MSPDASIAVRFGGQLVWVGEKGTYPIPDTILRTTKFRKNGWFDGRCKNKEFMEWVLSVEPTWPASFAA